MSHRCCAQTIKKKRCRNHTLTTSYCVIHQKYPEKISHSYCINNKNNINIGTNTVQNIISSVTNFFGSDKIKSSTPMSSIDYQTHIIPNITSVFQIITKVGQGAYGTVSKAKRLSDNKIVALKKMKASDQDDISDIIHEIHIWMEVSSCTSCVFVPIYNYYVVMEKGKYSQHIYPTFYVEMELLSEGDGWDLIHKRKAKLANHEINEQDFLKMMNQTALELIPTIMSVNEMHNSHILHRDIKPSNLLPDGNKHHLLIADFGLSCEQEECDDSGVGTTRKYQDPRYWSCGVFDVYSDIYSLGVTLYELLLLKIYSNALGANYESPSDNKKWMKTYKKEAVANIDIYLKKFSSNKTAYAYIMLTAIMGMMNPQIEYRPTLTSVIEAMKKKNVNLLSYKENAQINWIKSSTDCTGYD